MTVDKANELRLKTINLPYMEGSLYDPDNKDKDVINVIKEGKILSVLDVGFAIPKVGFCKEMFEMYYDMKPENYKEFNFDYCYTCDSPIKVKEAMCITSTIAKRKKSIISKRNFNFVGKDICLYGMVDKILYVWKSGMICFKDGPSDEGYELSILNDKLQIENRAYYIRIVRD